MPIVLHYKKTLIIKRTFNAMVPVAATLTVFLDSAFLNQSTLKWGWGSGRHDTAK